MTVRDAELLERWSRAGDARAFDSLVTDYSGLVYSACKRILQNDADAQDATQECFLQLAQKTPQIKTSLAAWLHTVATRRALSRIREEARRARRERVFAEQADTAAEAHWDDIQEFVDEAIQSLPDEYRMPVVASFLQRKSHADIAREAGVNRSTITRRIDRGIEGIRDYLKNKGIITTIAALTAALNSKMSEAMPVGLAGSLAKIGLSGGRFQTAGAVTGGGLLATLAGFFGGATTAKVAAGALAFAALVGGIWYANSGRDDAISPEPGAAESAMFADSIQTVEESPEFEAESEPESTPVAEAIIQALESIEAPPVGTTIEGRVFDATTNVGLDGVIVNAYFENERRGTTIVSRPDEDIRRAAASAETERGGRFTIPELGEGAYRLVLEAIEGYPETYDEAKRIYVGIHTPSSSPVEVDVPLEPGGILEGVAILGGQPLPNTPISIMTYAGDNAGPLGTLTTITDDRGRYRIEDLRRFEGSMIARRTQANGERQDALVVPATVEPGKVTSTTFDFISGTASIEGRVYFQNEQTPIDARIQVYFGWEDEGTYKEEVIRARTDETGHYIVPGLPAGNAEMHVYATDIDGSQSIETLVLAEGQHAVKNFILTASVLRCEITNIPARAVQVFLTAHPGEVDTEFKDIASFMALRNSMVTYAQLYPNAERKLSAELTGLKPGRYTIAAATWPAAYSFAAVEAYGRERFYKNLRVVSTFISIEENQPIPEIHLAFEPE